MRLVIGVGNRWRCDDAAGLEVARRLRSAGAPRVQVAVREGDQAGLIEDWGEAQDVVIVDAASSGSPPGKIHRHDAAAGPLAVAFSRTSTHAFGVAEAIELARALERLPRRLVVYAIEGERFEVGDALSGAAGRAVERLAGELAAREPTCA